MKHKTLSIKSGESCESRVGHVYVLHRVELFHGVGFDVQAARFEEKMLKERLQGLQNDQTLIADIIVRHTKISGVEAEKLFLEAAFVGTAEAKRLGIIDDVLDIQIPTGAPFLQLVFQR